MRTIAFLSASISAMLLATVHAAPTEQVHARSAELSCNQEDRGQRAQLIAGDYIYGGGVGVSLGYKSFTEGGKEILRVVKVDANDTTISPLEQVTRIQCNSTALNYFSSNVFNTSGPAPNPPVKLLANMGRHGISYCVGIQDPNSDPTDIVLVPCSDWDDDSQANQFWLSHYKYQNLLPLVGKSNTTHNLPWNNTWPILAPADDANPQEYRAGHNGGNDTAYRSFAIM